MYDINILKKQIKDLGITEGDTLLVRADLPAIGRLKSKDRMEYLNFIIDVLGSEGTVVGLSFTSGSFIKKNISKIFDGKNRADTGAFANLMLKHPMSLRSSHPTNSYVAIGKNAQFIIEGHDYTSGAYDPIRKLIELNAKMLLIGCVQNSPGFTTTHLAEMDLNLHKRIIFPWLDNIYFKDKDNSIKLFRRKDLGGCSLTFYKMYAYYTYEEKLKQGYIGNAYSLMINAIDAYTIDYKVLKENPKFNLCNDSLCSHCRARRWDNIQDLPFYLIKKFFWRKSVNN